MSSSPYYTSTRPNAYAIPHITCLPYNYIPTGEQSQQTSGKDSPLAFKCVIIKLIKSAHRQISIWGENQNEKIHISFMRFCIYYGFGCIFCTYVSGFDHHRFYGISSVCANITCNSGIDFCMVCEQRTQESVYDSINCPQRSFPFQHTAHTFCRNSCSGRVSPHQNIMPNTDFSKRGAP